MTYRDNDDEFTRNLNERIKELEDMSNEMNDQTHELEDQATKAEDETTKIEDETTNQAQAARQEGDTIFFTANVSANKPLKLNITNNNGDVDITGSDTDSVEIMATRQSGKDVDHGHWFFQQLDNEITLRPNWQVGSHVGEMASKLKQQLKEGFKPGEWSGKDFRFGLDINYDLTVRLPRHLADGSRVAVKTANGDGELRDVAAEVDFKTANGDIRVETVGGSLTVHSANGDLSARGVSGNVNASTANGDIHLAGITGSVESNTANGDVHLDGATSWVAIRTAKGDITVMNTTMKGGRLVTVAGDINVDASLVNSADYIFESVTGDIEITARVPESGATLSTKSLTGDVDVSGDWSKSGKRDWVIGDGKGPRLNAKTVNADIEVEAVMDSNLTSLDEEPAAAAKASTDTSTDEKKDGDINVNLDLELERAKGWIKDVGSKFGAMLSDMDSKRTDSTATDETTLIEPQAPVEPKSPEAPKVPEQVMEATAARRTRLLEAVKNGEMTVDEALAELDRDI